LHEGTPDIRTLTPKPSLPVRKASKYILPPEVLSGSGELVVLLKPADYKSTLWFCQKLGRIGEILNYEEGECSGYDSSKSFQDEDPSLGVSESGRRDGASV